MIRTSLILAAVLSTAAPAAAVDLTHNGSVMDATSTGDQIVIRYKIPRAGLKKAGIVKGSILFVGHVEAGEIEGTATAFKSGCENADYRVTGTIWNGRIELYGPGPKRQGCSWTLSPDSPHANLAFEGVPAEVATLDPFITRARTGEEMADVLRSSAPVATPEPVAEPVARNVTPPPSIPVTVAPTEAPLTDEEEAQKAEAEGENALYNSSEFQAQITESSEVDDDATPAPVATETPPAAAPEPAPPPVKKKKLVTDF